MFPMVFWDPKWDHVGTEWDLNATKWGPNRTKVGPNGTKWGPNGTKWGPNGTKWGPNLAKWGPSGDQVGNKWDQVGTKSKNVDFLLVLKGFWKYQKQKCCLFVGFRGGSQGCPRLASSPGRRRCEGPPVTL